jgi:hypothetical protein
MTLKTITLNDECYHSATIILLVTVQTSIVGIIHSVSIPVKDGGYGFANTDFSAGFAQTSLWTISVYGTGSTGF